MNTTAMILVAISAVTVVDMLAALYFRSLAERIESGETVSSNIEPERARRTTNLMLISAPIIWLIVTLMCFGVIPTQMDPIKF